MAKRENDPVRDRRFMYLSVPLSEVGAILLGDAKLVLDNKPRDLQIVRLRSNFLADTLDVVVASLEFPVVDGEAPRYDGPYHVEHLKDDE